ncbi:class I SAM-dependent methyltransferase [Parerythrobacter jejuensis]|uniref:Class I SAM-dependent methyltransferase n=1 Tax=Parerythrobacter jejuensis TaxID=795812 RepID=A0A845AKA7_9SPHN|nr:SAM-dependent methyltransferase [Parerythrobacter jejuensis]MXP31182.1 class I SAM-dependent methyltransferase [Parerythrobacter jejuensis]MXP33942.1 class I SAM-dependent methyltransferase [Parerythrobacter jejuensis]
MEQASGDLTAIFRRLIRNTGPISLSQYMGESNARYYDARDPLGSGGDFVTAPEISQMFGELIGLWLADMWINAGRPDYVQYVELGPGRATLAKDALRAAEKYGFRPGVHFVESSTALKEVQGKAVPEAYWHDDLSTVPMDVPLMIVANEFLDALPVRQLVKVENGWRERMVGLDGDAFVYVAGGRPMDAAVPVEWRDADVGTILETCPAAAANMYEVAGRLAEQGGAALFVDYGHAKLHAGSTLQAVREHTKVNPLEEPGTADLTALVDFETLARIAQSRDVRVQGVVEQGKWLSALGIEGRAQTLAHKAPHYSAEIHAAKDRLIQPDQMGSLFKVLGLAAPGWPGGAGFTGD